MVIPLNPKPKPLYLFGLCIVRRPARFVGLRHAPQVLLAPRTPGWIRPPSWTPHKEPTEGPVFGKGVNWFRGSGCRVCRCSQLQNFWLKLMSCSKTEAQQKLSRPEPQERLRTNAGIETHKLPAPAFFPPARSCSHEGHLRGLQ